MFATIEIYLFCPMSLEDINNSTPHSRDLHADRVRHSDVFEPANHKGSDEVNSPFVQTETWNDQEEPPKMGDIIIPPQSRMITFHHPWRKRIALILGGIVALLLIGGIVMKLRPAPFSEESVVLALVGPNTVASAEMVTFTLNYTNRSDMDLKESRVVFSYPETFHPSDMPALSVKKSRADMSLGTITSHFSGKVTLTGKFYGSKGDDAPLSATLQYVPSNTTSAFTVEAKQAVTISSSSIFFEITAASELASGQEVQYDIRYGNLGDISFSNLKVKLDYPEGFVFTDASSKPVEGDMLWNVGDLAPRQEGTISVRGRLSGSRNDQRTVHGSIGFFQGDGAFASYGDHEWKTRIVASPLSVRQTINGKTEASIKPGEYLQYVIDFTNEGNVGIRDLIVTVEMDSPYIDLSTLSFSSSGSGAYNKALKSLVWKASDVPALRYLDVGQSGRVQFSVNTYSDIEKRGARVGQSNTIKTVARVDSPDIPAIVGLTKVVASNETFIKFNTTVIPQWKGFYQDAIISNTGPVPPIIGEETTYTLHFSLKNTLNNVIDGQVNILLPTGIRYTGKKLPENESILFNERRNELIWSVGSFGAGEVREIVFQVAVVPDPSSLDKEIVLASEAVFIGKDQLTGENIEVKTEETTNNIREDEVMGGMGYRVRAAAVTIPL